MASGVLLLEKIVGAHYTILTVSNHQNSIGSYLGPVQARSLEFWEDVGLSDVSLR